MIRKVIGVVALAFGILILIACVLGFLMTSAQISEYENALNQESKDDPGNRDIYHEAVAGQVCTGVGIVIGLISIVIGIFLYFKQPSQQQSQPYYQPPYQPPEPYYQDQPPPPPDYQPPQQP